MLDILTAENLMALLTLTGLEIVLGIDNIVFIAILTCRLPEHQRPAARRIGLTLAMGTRILLLLTISLIMKFTSPLFAILGHPVSGRDLILLGGGLFLIAKATLEIHERIDTADKPHVPGTGVSSFLGVIVQVMILDIIFSLDSVITAVGMARSVPIMVAAIVVAVGVMMVFAGSISHYIEKHPSLKVLALSFLLLVGVFLVADGMGRHIEKGYIYSAMTFSLFVEALNLRVGGRGRTAAHLSPPSLEASREEAQS